MRIIIRMNDNEKYREYEKKEWNEMNGMMIVIISMATVRISIT